MNQNLDEYLHNRSKMVDENLIRHVRSHDNFIQLTFNKTSNINLKEIYQKGQIFTMFDKEYALLDGDLFELYQTNYTLIHSFYFAKQGIKLTRVIMIYNIK